MGGGGGNSYVCGWRVVSVVVSGVVWVLLPRPGSAWGGRGGGGEKQLSELLTSKISARRIKKGE